MDICYLCSSQIDDHDKVSGDHVVPRQFIKRKQPKVRGFDFAGKLKTHESCNNEFGPETYCQKALIVLSSIYNKNCFFRFSVPGFADQTAMALNPDCFPGFTDRDRKFFKIIDARDFEVSDLKKADFYINKPKTDLKKSAFNVALSVLSKSGAALLYSRKLSRLPSKWRIVAATFTGAEDLDFDQALGETQAFDLGVKAWLKVTEAGDWLVIYKSDGVLAYLLYWFSGSDTSIDLIKPLTEEADLMYFEGDKLIELGDWEWRPL